MRRGNVGGTIQYPIDKPFGKEIICVREDSFAGERLWNKHVTTLAQSVPKCPTNNPNISLRATTPARPDSGWMVSDTEASNSETEIARSNKLIYNSCITCIGRGQDAYFQQTSCQGHLPTTDIHQLTNPIRPFTAQLTVCRSLTDKGV